MAWFRLDDQGAFHAKVLAAGNEAYGAWCRAGQWSSAHLTEGRIPRATALSIAPAKVWQRLINAKGTSQFGLVEADGDDYVIHDYLDYNPSAADALAKRAARSAAGRAGGRRSAERRAQAEAPRQPNTSAPAQAIASATVQQTSTPSPSPSPTPIPRDQKPPITPREAGAPTSSRKPSIVEVGTVRCEKACEVFVATLADAGWPRADIREPWERRALCDAINVHLRADESIEGVLAELRRAVREWVEAHRDAPQFTSGWAARKFGDWLTTGRKTTARPGVIAAPKRRASAVLRELDDPAGPLPPRRSKPLGPDDRPMTPEEAAAFERQMRDDRASADEAIHVDLTRPIRIAGLNGVPMRAPATGTGGGGE